MRIALFTDTYTPDINGVVTSVRTLEQELKKNGHEVYIITSSHNKRITRENNVIKLPGISIKRLYGYNISGFYSRNILRYLENLNLNVIHAHTEFGIGIYARIASFQLDIPLVYTYHTMYEDYTHYVTKYTKGHFEKSLKKAIDAGSRVFADTSTELIVPSYKTADAMLKYGVKNTVNVIPTGINLEAFKPGQFDQKQIEEIRTKFNIKPTDFLVINIGRIAAEKNINEIVDAFKIIKDKNTANVKLLIVGDGPGLNDIKQKIKDDNLESIAFTAGKVTHDQVAIMYQSADVFVSTSTSETQGLTYIEAMASKLPIICKYDKNLENIIKNDVNGYFINTPEELAQRIIEMSEMDKEKYNNLAENASKDALVYSSDIFYQKIMVVYNNAIRNWRYKKLKNNYTESKNNHKTKKIM